MTAVTDSAMTGGSAITSYSLEWDQGTGNVFMPVIGFNSNNLLLTHTFDSLTKGASYTIRYRVRNKYGWSPYSDTIEQIAAKKPDAPVAPHTSNTQTSVTITWTLPYNGGALIESFVLQIQTKSGDWAEDLTYCNARTDQTVITNRLCAIPMPTLHEAPFLLE